MSALRRLGARPSSAASSAPDQYFGPGLSIQEQADKPPITRASALEEENSALREQVQHLQHLLTLISPSDSDHGPSTSNNTASTTSSSKLPKAQALQPLQRHKAQIAQLQRQVNTLQAELQSGNSMCLEADAIIHEASRRLEPLMTAVHSSGNSSSSSGRSPAAHGPVPGAGRSSGAHASSGVGGRGSAVVASTGIRSRAGPGPSQQVLQECGDLAAWCKQMQHRLARARAQASVALRKLPSEEGGSWSSSKGPQHTAHNMHTSLPYVAAGGNRFLQQVQDAPPPSIPALCAGQGILLVDVSQVHTLEVQLGALAPNLAHLAIALKTVLLPAMPWLSHGLGQQLLSDVAGTADAAAAAAARLAELACLLPASCSLAGAAPRAAAKHAAAKATAREQANEWSSANVQWDGSFGVVGSQSQDRTGMSADGENDKAAGAGSSMPSDEEQQMFEQLQAALASQPSSSQAGVSDARGIAKRRSSGGSNIGSRGQEPFSIGGSTSSPSRVSSRAIAGTGAAVPATVARRGLEAFEKLRLRLMVQAWQRRVLEVQLGFVAEVSGAQARLVSQLVIEVVDAVKACTAMPDAEAEASERRQLLIAVQSLLKATRLLEQRPGEAANRGAAECLLRHAEVLELLPEVLESCAAPAIQAAAIAAAQRAYGDYSSRLHAGQGRCSTASRHAKQQAARLQRQSEER